MSGSNLFLAFGNDDNDDAFYDLNSLGTDVTLNRTLSGNFPDGFKTTWNFWFKLKTAYPSVLTEFVGSIAPNSVDIWHIAVTSTGQITAQNANRTNGFNGVVTFTTNAALQIGKWYQITVVWDSVGAVSAADFWKIYIDGVNQAGVPYWNGYFYPDQSNVEWNGPYGRNGGFVDWYFHPGTLNALTHDISYIQGKALLPSNFVNGSLKPAVPSGATPLNGDAYFRIADGTRTSTFTNTQTLV